MSYLLIGLAHVVLGSVLENLITHYGRDYTSGSQLIFNQFAGFLAGVLATPRILRKLGGRGTVLLAVGALTLAESVYSMLPSWRWMLAAGPVAGFGFGMIEAVIGAMTIRFVKERKAVAMSRLEVFFGIGALLMPLLASSLIIRGVWHVSFSFVALLSLAAGLLWFFLSFGEADELLSKKSAAAMREADRYDRRSLPMLCMMALFFLLYVGLEMSFVHFIPSILIHKTNATTAVATVSIAVFWATMSIGRWYAGVIAEKTGYIRYLLASCAGTLVFLTMLFFNFDLWSSFLVVFGLGLVMAGIFAIGLVLANELIPGMTDRTTSILVAAGGIGGALVPRAVGWMMDRFPLNAALWLFVGLTLCMLVIMIAAAMTGKGERQTYP